MKTLNDLFKEHLQKLMDSNPTFKQQIDDMVNGKNQPPLIELGTYEEINQMIEKDKKINE